VAITFLSDGAGGSALVPTTANATVWSVVGSGSVVAQTTVKEHGWGSFKHDTVASASAYVVAGGVLADAGRRISVRMRFDHTPDPAAGTGIIRIMTSTSGNIAEVRLDSAGHLRLYAGSTGGTLQQTGSTTLSMNGTTWYRIAFCYTITSSSVNEFRVYLDGTQELTASDVASQTTGTSHLRVGYTGTTAGANKVMYSQDHYVDNDTGLTDPGNVRVTGKMPASISGTTNAWATVGSGTNRWDRVDERPASTANRYTQTANTQVIEQFLVEADSVGDDDLTGATVLGKTGWAHYAVAAGAGSTLISMYLQGGLFTLTTTAASGVYQTHFKVATSAHASADLIGLRSSGTTADSNFAEAGILIAYTTATSVSITGALATATAQGHAATTTISVPATAATATGQGHAATISIVAPGALATASAQAFAATVSYAITMAAELATASAQGHAATIAVSVPAALGSATAQGHAAIVTVTVGGATASATAQGHAAVVTAEGGGGAVSVTAELATASAQGFPATVTITVPGAQATGSAQAYAATITTVVAAALSTASAQGFPATVTITVPAARATSTAQAFAASISTTVAAALASATGQGHAASVRITVPAAFATATAQAFAASVGIGAPLMFGAGFLTIVPSLTADEATIVISFSHAETVIAPSLSAGVPTVAPSVTSADSSSSPSFSSSTPEIGS
jgi:hypothetical protein